MNVEELKDYIASTPLVDEFHHDDENCLGKVTRLYPSKRVCIAGVFVLEVDNSVPSGTLCFKEGGYTYQTEIKDNVAYGTRTIL